MEHTLQRLSEMESLVNDKLLQSKKLERVVSPPRATSVMDEVETEQMEGDQFVEPTASTSKAKNLDVSGPVAPYPAKLKNFWYPVAFSADIDEKTMVSFISSHHLIIAVNLYGLVCVPGRIDEKQWQVSVLGSVIILSVNLSV